MREDDGLEVTVSGKGESGGRLGGIKRDFRSGCWGRGETEVKAGLKKVGMCTSTCYLEGQGFE